MLQKSLVGPQVKCAFFNETTSLLNCILKQTLFPKMDHNFWKIVEKTHKLLSPIFLSSFENNFVLEKLFDLNQPYIVHKIILLHYQQFFVWKLELWEGKNFIPYFTVIKSFKWKVWKLCNTKWAYVSQCGNFMIFYHSNFTWNQF